MFVLFLGFLGGASSDARADAFSYSELSVSFGQVKNFSCGASPGGVCGAAAVVNSFVYLQNIYPTIYGTGLAGETLADQTDAATQFADTGWTANGQFYQGYYTRCGAACSLDVYTTTEQDWITTHGIGVGSTVLSTYYSGSPLNNRAPTINDLAQEIKDQEDVELFVKGTYATGPKMGQSFAHAITLTAISCDASMNCNITYQDPNNPASPQTVAIDVNTLQFSNLPASGITGTAQIYAEFAESPVPELNPSSGTSGLVLVAGAVLMIRGRRKIPTS